MRTALFQLSDILNAFQKKKVLTKKEMLDAAGCSTMTAWRLLKQHGYFTSYNNNARHYTIRGIPQFDQKGLWAFREARFSKWGSLTKTIIGLVQESSAGLSAGQLQQLLTIKNVKPTLTQLIKKQSLTREEIGGRFVYFPQQQTARRQKLKQRKAEVEQAEATRSLPPLEHIIALLVEIIRRPENTLRQWARQLARQGLRIPISDIQAVLDHYPIDKKNG